jgi:hypothetical protein
MSNQTEQNYLDNRVNLASPSNQFQVAQKSYLTFNQGVSGYNDSPDNKLEEQATKIADAFTEKFTADSSTLKTQIDTYEGLLLNFKNVAELYLKYKNENIQLISDLKNETSDVLTNERKSFYQDQKIGGLNGFYFYFLLTIYVICVVCFGVFSIIYPSQTNWKIKLATFIGFILLPFFSTWILGKIIYLIYIIYELLPKNVYVQKNY